VYKDIAVFLNFKEKYSVLFTAIFNFFLVLDHEQNITIFVFTYLKQYIMEIKSQGRAIIPSYEFNI